MRKGISLLVLVVLFFSCSANPLTVKKTMAFVDNSLLFPSSFQQYEEFISENEVITGTPHAEMVETVGANIRGAAEKWLAAEGYGDYLKDYNWEYKLIESDEVNAWCMPGGKIAVYTGILPMTQTEDGLATVIGHEVAHALLNHGQQRVSAGVLQGLGSVAVSILTSDSSEEIQDIAAIAYGAGSHLFGTLPFSRSHESEADQYGLMLMSIAGYNPDESVLFWERMASVGSGTIEFLSTHPSDTSRIRQLKEWIPDAKNKAKELETIVKASSSTAD
jgi:predicted Zn-dependent protease